MSLGETAIQMIAPAIFTLRLYTLIILEVETFFVQFHILSQIEAACQKENIS